MNRAASGYFNVGDLILYGKYKNKKGRVVRMWTDEKGHPTIEIEPIPKGRKKNKTMGLFKIWHAPEELKETMKSASTVLARFQAHQEEVMSSSSALRVAARFQGGLIKKALRGETVVRGNVRIHQYADHFRITDLTNAGKRGKTCRVMSVSPKIRGNADAWMDRMDKAIEPYSKYDEIKAFFEDVLHDYPGEIRIFEETARGVDVLPGEVKKINMEWKKGESKFRLTALPNDFTLVHTVTFAAKDDPKRTFDQDTGYFNVGKKDAQVFYNWALANESEIKSMGLDQIRKLWSDLKIRYDNW